MKKEDESRSPNRCYLRHHTKGFPPLLKWHIVPVDPVDGDLTICVNQLQESIEQRTLPRTCPAQDTHLKKIIWSDMEFHNKTKPVSRKCIFSNRCTSHIHHRNECEKIESWSYGTPLSANFSKFAICFPLPILFYKGKMQELCQNQIMTEINSYDLAQSCSDFEKDI